jgi:outer membrane protein OmpA-like peptidoglycan-associated protein
MHTATAGLAIVFVLAATGCATKKHVRASIDPLERRIGELEGKSREADKSIAGLEQSISRTDERLRGADARAGQAIDDAARANQRAAKSGEQAEAASQAAARGTAQAMARVDERAGELDGRIRGLEDYQVVAEEEVLFDVNRSTLNDGARQELDTLAAKVLALKRFVVEVQGYTDKTGPTDYNLDLSRKRANSVVRYLTGQHKVPLHRVHLLGLGADDPVADNTTRDGRRQNRRVEVRVYTADEALTGKKVEARLDSR